MTTLEVIPPNIHYPKARQAYQCDGMDSLNYCTRTIAKGEQYTRFRVYLGYGQYETFRYCRECHPVRKEA